MEQEVPRAILYLIDKVSTKIGKDWQFNSKIRGIFSS